MEPPVPTTSLKLIHGLPERERERGTPLSSGAILMGSSQAPARLHPFIYFKHPWTFWINDELDYDYYYFYHETINRASCLRLVQPWAGVGPDASVCLCDLSWTTWSTMLLDLLWTLSWDDACWLNHTHMCTHTDTRVCELIKVVLSSLGHSVRRVCTSALLISPALRTHAS